MNIRHPHNKNLIIHNLRTFNQMPVWLGGDLIRNYLELINQTLQRATLEHRRTLAVRFDLRFPLYAQEKDSSSGIRESAISSFFQYLKLLIQSEIDKKRVSGKSVHNCRVRYCWAKERLDSESPHYHCVLLLNKDTYYSLRNTKGDGSDLAAKIFASWARVVNTGIFDAGALVHFPDNHTYRLDVNSDSYTYDYQQLFYRLSYLAKTKSKEFGIHSNSFGCSRK